MILCRNRKLIEVAGGFKLSCDIVANWLPSDFYLQFDAQTEPLVDTDDMNWALIGLLYPAMLSGENLVIEGRVSPRLLHIARTDLQFLLTAFNPQLKMVDIEAESISQRVQRAKNVSLGFSGGVDSFASLIIQQQSKVPEHLRPTYLAMFSVGAMGNSAQDRQLFELRKNSCRALAQKLQLSTCFLDSNLNDIFNAASVFGSVSLAATHSLRTASAAHALGRGIGLHLHSSSHTYRSTAVSGGRKEISVIEPIMLPLLSSERLEFQLVGAHMGRREKTEIISVSDDARRWLDVCVALPEKRIALKGLNCGCCQKCVRTLLMLEALGTINKFEEVFDLDTYYRRRKRLLRKLFARAHTGQTRSDKHAIAMAKNSGLKLPFYPLPLVMIRNLISKSRKALRR